MAKSFHLTVAQIGKNLFDGEAVTATFPGKEGVFEVLTEHEAFVSELASGAIHLTTPDGAKQQFETTGGVVEVAHNQVTALL